jgi:hypothetical protein
LLASLAKAPHAQSSGRQRLWQGGEGLHLDYLSDLGPHEVSIPLARTIIPSKIYSLPEPNWSLHKPIACDATSS